MALELLSVLGGDYAALSRERDSELRGEGLLALAGRQERQHRPELAVELYSRLLQDPEISTSVSRRAQARLGALRGEGELGARAEVLFSRFNDEVTEPTSLLAMATAGLAFRATRFIALGRLASSTPGILTRGSGARALAGLAGFGVEATVFPLAGRLGNVALGRELDWSARALSHELISSFMTLGALRAGGLATGALANRSNLFRPAIQQAGMFGGIVLGHELEARAGLRDRTHGSIALLDSLVTLLHFNVAGRLSRSLMGEGLRSWEHRIEQQTQSLGNSPRRLPNLSSLELSSGLVPVGARPGLEMSSETVGPDRLYMTQDGDGSGKSNGDPRRKTTIPGLSRRSLLPDASRAPLFLENKDFRVLNLSLKAREVRPAEGVDHLQSRVISGLETYLRSEKDPAVLLYPENTAFDAAQQGDLRIQMARLFREFGLPEDFTLTVVVPADRTAIHFAKDPQGIMQLSRRPLLRRNLSRESAPPRTEVVILKPSRSDSSERIVRPGSRPDANELKTGMERLIARVISDIEQNPSFRLTKGRIGTEDLDALAAVFSANLPPNGRRFTLLWLEKGGGQVQFVREGEAIRADWKAFQSSQRTFWYLPTQSALGQFQFYADGSWTPHAWQAEPGYSENVERRLNALWQRMGVVGPFEQAGNREEGPARQGAILARLAQHWLQKYGPTDRTWDPMTLQYLVDIHQTLEAAQAHLDFGLTRRFLERLGNQGLRRYESLIAHLPARTGESRLVPVNEFEESAQGVAYIPLEDSLRATFVRHLFHDLGRPRFPMENYRLTRDPRRLGELYRETLRGRIVPLGAAIQLAKRSNAAGNWSVLMQADPKTLTGSETKLRAEVGFFLGEIPEHSRILRMPPSRFHREFIQSIFQGGQSLMNPYLRLRSELETLPEPTRLLYRVRDLPTQQELEAYMGRVTR
jgi:hypothetical protein